MGRVISNSPKRICHSLDGVWEFEPVAATCNDKPSVFNEKLPVPGVWESAFKYFSYRGQGAYRREFEVVADKPADLRIVFEAVSHTARVWLDDEFLGEHYGAHTAFEFYCRDVAPGAHTLTVLADNTFGPHNPLTKATQDVYTYGGIPRPVCFEILPEVFIAHACATPLKEDDEWHLQVAVRLESMKTNSMPSTAVVTMNEERLGEMHIGLDGSGGGIFNVGNVNLWYPSSPSLYTVSVTAGGDVWRERIGFRTISTQGRKLLLNGEPIVLQGVNRHEFHPDSGSALPPVVHFRDIEILKRLGANFVRGSHYPNDPLFLDLCDENGILFWEELSHWQPDAEDMASEAFRRASLNEIAEMVGQHRHHPCIILWGMMNEAETNAPVAKETIKLFADRFRELDPTRLVTYACNHLDDDVALESADVVSVNLYPGWYGSGLDDVDEAVARTLATLKSRAPGKPVIFSEFGAAALKGVRSFEPRKWTEDYQSELIRRIVSLAQASGVVSGAAAWQYCDARTSSDRSLDRPREYNNKGILTENRDPKLAFHALREQFKKPWAILTDEA